MIAPTDNSASLSSARQSRQRFLAAYTDAPALHPNPVLATLQLALWLFFCPSAWRRFITRAEPTLNPDFSLAQLSPAQFQNPQIRRVLLLGHVISPLLISAILSLELLALGVPIRLVAIRVLACFVMSVGGSMIFGTGSADAVGIAAGMMGGLVGSAAFAFAALRAGAVVFSVDANVSSMIQDFLVRGPAGQTSLTVAFGLAAAGMFVAVGGVGAGVSDRRAQLNRRPTTGGVLVGLLCGAFFFAAATASAALMPFPIAVSFGGFLAGLISARWITGNWFRSFVFGIACALNNHVMVNVLGPLSGDIVVIGIMMGIILGAWFALPYVLAEEIAGSWSGAIAGSLGFSGGWILTLSAASKETISFGAHFLPGLFSLEVAVLLGLSEVLWRPLLLFPIEEAWNLILLRIDQNKTSDTTQLSLLRFHSVFWDEHQRWRLAGLDEHLLLIAERNPEEGAFALERVATGAQRWAASAAQIELVARKLLKIDDAEKLAKAHLLLGEGDGLDGPVSALFARLASLSKDVEAALSQGSAHNQRLGLGTVQQRLDSLVAELDRSADVHATRFRGVAAQWKTIVEDHAQKLAAEVELRQEIDNPYVIGVPLSLAQELFVGRTDISARIEQLLLDRRRPPLMLYGQRRMGKTSLLNNLGRLLPTAVVPLFVDLQGPASSASDHAGFLFNLARGMIDSAKKQRNLVLPPLPRETLTSDPFTAFDEWLDLVESVLDGRTALLTLDEFEALASALQSGRLQEASVLGMLRHLVQHRQRIKMLIASSHTLEELKNYASYFVNVQVIQVGYLADADALRLIESPMPQFALRYEPEAARRVLSLTSGHPFLVQLLCAEIINLKNEQNPAVRRLCTSSDVIDAVPEALAHGSFFFADIERNQVDEVGVQLLRFLAAQGEDTLTSLDTIRAQKLCQEPELGLRQLIRRDLVERKGSAYRFQVELIRRWFAEESAGES